MPNLSDPQLAPPQQVLPDHVDELVHWVLELPLQRLLKLCLLSRVRRVGKVLVPPRCRLWGRATVRRLPFLIPPEALQASRRIIVSELLKELPLYGVGLHRRPLVEISRVYFRRYYG